MRDARFSIIVVESIGCLYGCLSGCIHRCVCVCVCVCALVDWMVDMGRIIVVDRLDVCMGVWVIACIDVCFWSIGVCVGV